LSCLEEKRHLLDIGLSRRQLKTATADHPSVIAVKAEIQSYRGFSWIPTPRFAAAGMTK
jgi:hypothetical protein